MRNIVFVCLGNICRSPMAEAIMKRLLKERHLESEFYVTSRATSNEELGNEIYPKADQKLKEKGILNFSHQAEIFKKEEYDKYDFIIVMEDSNIYHLLGIIGADPKNKIRKLIPDYNIADPWYTRNFELAYEVIEKGCISLLNELIK